MNDGISRQATLECAARITEDLLCIILLVVLPDAVLEATGLYKHMETIREMRDNGAD